MGVIRALLASRLLWAGAALLLGAAAARTAARALARDPRFLARPVGIEARGPAWAGREVVAPVLARLQALGPVNLFHPAFERLVRDALARDPGVAEVGGVRRHWPRAYSVTFTLRRPYAVVAHASGPVPVTREGVALPSGRYEEAARSLWTVRGVDSARPRPGRRWEDPRLQAALETLAQVAPHLPDLAPLGLEAVEAGRAADPLHGVVLLGAGGLRVRWGRPAATGENPPERKAAFLRVVASDPSRAQGYEIDVRYAEIGLRRLPAP